MNKNKNTIIILIILLLILTTIILYLSDNRSTLNKYESNFAIKDSSSVTKIFLTDKENNKIVLTKKQPGYWILNQTYIANTDLVNILLKTLISLDAKAKVAKAEHNNVIRRMAAIGIKVEIYQQVYRIFINDKFKWFPYEKLTKIYYVGDATKDNLGTYMLMQGAKHPYIVQIKGFNGFLYTRYSTKEEDWRDHTIFNHKLANIKTITLEFPDNPNESWILNNLNNKKFELYQLNNHKIIEDVDTLKIMEYLGSFNNVKFESFLNNMDNKIKDSILNSTPWHILTLTDINQNKYIIKTFHKKAATGEVDLKGNPVIWDRDRLYALINNKDFVIIQFFVFDKILRPLNFFKLNNK
ncbi:MAG TPA: DUF4340 domain-containing protein [Bacteroidales bacterium]|nr:DUF4340 domain-containing protein [Bacteroidales bacterium]